MKSFSIDNKSTTKTAKILISLNANLNQILFSEGFNNLKAFHISHTPETSMPVYIILLSIKPNKGNSVLTTKVEAIHINVIRESCSILKI